MPHAACKTQAIGTGYFFMLPVRHRQGESDALYAACKTQTRATGCCDDSRGGQACLVVVVVDGGCTARVERSG